MGNSLLDRISNLEKTPKIIIFIVLSIVCLWGFHTIFGLIDTIIPFSGLISFICSIGIIAYLGLKIFRRHL